MRLLVLLSLLFLSFASAQSWTIQTASYRDYRLAQRSLERLLRAGFNAYSEFYMLDNKQYVRVRIGCFFSQDAAQSYLENMQSFGQTNAYVVPNSYNSDKCVKRSIGFIAPEKWGVYRLNNERIVFWVSLADVTGFIAHDQSGWKISQTGSDLLASPAQAPMTGYFSQSGDGGPILFNPGNQSALKLSNGKLLWQSGFTAIIQEGDTIVSYEIKGGQ